MSKTKATVLDDISVNVLQLVAPAVTPSITYICRPNLSLLTGEFPMRWKEAKVKPLHKGRSEL